MSRMSNVDFQNRINFGDMISFTGRSKDKYTFVGWVDCDNDNPLCKTCKGHIEYIDNRSVKHNGCFRHGSNGVAMIHINVWSDFLKDEEILL